MNQQNKKNHSIGINIGRKIKERNKERKFNHDKRENDNFIKLN